MEEAKETLKEKCYRLQKKFDYVLDDEKYIIAHLDGRSFSKMVKNKFKRPFDERFINAMDSTAIYLCENVQGVKFAYTQSDEITLVIKKETEKSEIFFNGRMCKLQSILASLATSKFNQIMLTNDLSEMIYYQQEESVYTIASKVGSSPLYQFDCKVWNVDSANDVVAWMLFRSIDCIRNSKQQTAQTYLPDKALLGKNADEQIEMLKVEKDIDWNAYFPGEKFGRIVSKQTFKYLLPLGESVTRAHWVQKPFFDLTKEENRNNFIEEFELK